MIYDKLIDSELRQLTCLQNFDKNNLFISLSTIYSFLILLFVLSFESLFSLKFLSLMFNKKIITFTIHRQITIKVSHAWSLLLKVNTQFVLCLRRIFLISHQTKFLLCQQQKWSKSILLYWAYFWIIMRKFIIFSRIEIYPFVIILISLWTHN